MKYYMVKNDSDKSDKNSPLKQDFPTDLIYRLDFNSEVKFQEILCYNLA